MRMQVPNAPELVQDLLIAHGGSLSADQLCRAGALFGIRETAMRVALTRLVACGRLSRLAGGSQAERDHLQALGLSSRALLFCLAELAPRAQADAQALWDRRRLAQAHRGPSSALVRSQRLLARRPPEVALRTSLVPGRTVIAHLLRDPVLPPEMLRPGSRTALVGAMSA